MFGKKEELQKISTAYKLMARRVTKLEDDHEPPHHRSLKEALADIGKRLVALENRDCPAIGGVSLLDKF